MLSFYFFIIQYEKKKIYKLNDLFFKDLRKIETSDLQNLSRKQIITQNNYCEKIYSYLIVKLSKNLNQIHNENLSSRAWEIIIGEWLKNLVYYLHKNYSFLDFNFKKKKLKNF